MTQEELAKKVGYKSRSTINKIELDINDVSESKLVKIAKALDCSPADFIEPIEHPTSTPDRIMKYAQLLASLDDAKQDNVMQYIEFLSKREG
jgi:transcriptional regulator with XRE-family HTH domain